MEIDALTPEQEDYLASWSALSDVERVVEPLRALAAHALVDRLGALVVLGGLPPERRGAARAARARHSSISASASPCRGRRRATKRSFITAIREALSVVQVQKTVAKPTARPSSSRAMSWNPSRRGRRSARATARAAPRRRARPRRSRSSRASAAAGRRDRPRVTVSIVHGAMRTSSTRRPAPCSARTASSASTTSGSNWRAGVRGAARRRASAWDIGSRYGRCGDHRVVGVAGEDDPAADRDRRAGEAVRVAAAVPALVLVAHERGDRLELGRAAQDALADHGVLAHDRPLRVGRAARACRGSRSGSPPCRRRAASRRRARCSTSRSGRPSRGATAVASVHDLLGVGVGVVVARVDRRGQRADGGRRAAARLAQQRGHGLAGQQLGHAQRRAGTAARRERSISRPCTCSSRASGTAAQEPVARRSHRRGPSAPERPRSSGRAGWGGRSPRAPLQVAGSTLAGARG